MDQILPRKRLTADEIIAVCMERMCFHCEWLVPIQEQGDGIVHIYVGPEPESQRIFEKCDASALWKLRGKLEGKPDKRLWHWHKWAQPRTWGLMVRCDRCGNLQRDYKFRSCPVRTNPIDWIRRLFS